MIEPTEDMVIAGFECDAMDQLCDAVLAKKGWPYSCRQSAELVTAIFKAMVAEAPAADVAKERERFEQRFVTLRLGKFVSEAGDTIYTSPFTENAWMGWLAAKEKP